MIRSIYLVVAALLCLPFCTHAQFSFTLANTIAGVDHNYENGNTMGGGSAFFDYDNDGDLDIWATGGQGRDGLYENIGGGQFIEVGIAAGLDTTAGIFSNTVITGDVDNDGDRDVFVTTGIGYSNYLFRNNGDGTFTDVSEAANIVEDTIWTMSASFGDYNLDGNLDLFVGNFIMEPKFQYGIDSSVIGFEHDCHPNWLYLGQGDGRFINVTTSVMKPDSGCVLATAWTDFDMDNDLDIFIANDFGEWVVPNTIYRNLYPTNKMQRLYDRWGGMYGMGIAIGDPDHDSDLDYYVTNIARNRLYINSGNGILKDRTTEAGVEDIYAYDTSTAFTVGWGTVFADLDNDMWADLLVSNGAVRTPDFLFNSFENPNRCYRNNTNGTFTDVAEAAGLNDEGRARGLATADYDGDGDIDVLFNRIESIETAGPDPILLYRNDNSNGNHWLQVACQGTINNRDGFGAKVEITVGGETWIDEINGGSSHGSQNASYVHFGMGTHAMADKIRVIWPGGHEQELLNVPADQILTIVEDTSSMRLALAEATEMLIRPNPVLTQTNIFFNLEQTTEVSVTIMNMAGQSVQNLFAGEMAAGAQQLQWNTEDAYGRSVPAGMYLAELWIGSEREVQQIMVVR